MVFAPLLCRAWLPVSLLEEPQFSCLSENGYVCIESKIPE